MTATVTGTLLLPDGTPDRGAVSFHVLDPAVFERVLDSTAEHIVTGAPVVASLDDTGSFSVTLTDSAAEGWRLDDETMAAGGMPYVVTVNTQGLRDCYTAFIPEGASRFEDLIVLDWDPNVVLVPGLEGPDGPPGPPGPQGDPGDPAALSDADPLPVGDTNDPGADLLGSRADHTHAGTRITRPNVDDRLVEQWNGSAWSVVDYDSGWRDIAGLISPTNGWGTPLRARLRRVGPKVELNLEEMYVPDEYQGSAWFLELPTGFNCPGSHYNGGNSFAQLFDGNMGSPTSDQDNGRNPWIVGRTGDNRLYTKPLNGQWPANPTASIWLRGGIHWTTDDSIPTSLPGTLVIPAPN